MVHASAGTAHIFGELPRQLLEVFWSYEWPGADEATRYDGNSQTRGVSGAWCTNACTMSSHFTLSLRRLMSRDGRYCCQYNHARSQLQTLIGNCAVHVGEASVSLASEITRSSMRSLQARHTPRRLLLERLLQAP